MAFISRYEKIALGATAVFTLLCGAVLLGGTDANQSYRISAAPAQLEVTGIRADGMPDSLLPGEKIDLNHAPIKDLERLPGIGEVKAAAIAAYREEFGAFACIEEITKVPGIGEGMLNALRDYITVSEE